jgi:integrase
MQVVMDLCYLTGQRIGDVLKIQYADLTDDGIFIEQQKTGKRLVIGWTQELHDVIARAKESPNTVRSIKYVVSGRAGTMRAHSNVWKTFKTGARSVGLGDITLHDLRAMSGTDADNEGKDASKLLGHTNQRTTQIYLRDKSAKVVQGPSKKAG